MAQALNFGRVSQTFTVLNEVRYFFEKLTIFVYDPIVHTDYIFSYITNYLYHLIKGLLITVFVIIVNFFFRK